MGRGKKIKLKIQIPGPPLGSDSVDRWGSATDILTSSSGANLKNKLKILKGVIMKIATCSWNF